MSNKARIKKMKVFLLFFLAFITTSCELSDTISNDDFERIKKLLTFDDIINPGPDSSLDSIARSETIKWLDVQPGDFVPLDNPYNGEYTWYLQNNEFMSRSGSMEAEQMLAHLLLSTGAQPISMRCDYCDKVRPEKIRVELILYNYPSHPPEATVKKSVNLNNTPTCPGTAMVLLNNMPKVNNNTELGHISYGIRLTSDVAPSISELHLYNCQVEHTIE